MKKKVASKVLVGALASAMVFSMAACGNDDNNPSGSNPSGSSTPNVTNAPNTPSETPKPAPMKVSFAVPSDEEHLEANEWYDKLVNGINEYTNMDVEWQWMETGSYYEQLNEKVKAGNVADIVIGPTDPLNGDTTVLSAAKEGLFWDLAPYINDYDNLAAIPEATKKALSTNGSLYFLPRCRDLGRLGFGYRQDWAEKLQLKISDPMTWQEFKDMLYAFTYNDPDGNGVNDTQGLVLDQWYDAFKSIFAWFNVPDQWGLDEKGDLIHYTQTKAYKTALKEIRSLYEDGLINDGSVEGIPVFTEIAAGKIRTDYASVGKVGVFIQVLDDVRKWELGGGGLREQGFGTVEKPAVRLESAVDTGNGIHVKANKGGYNGTIMISTINIKTEDQLRRVLQFLNDLNDGEMIQLMDYGWEGKTYNIDENGYVNLWTKAEDGLEEAGVGSTKYRNGFNQTRTMITAPANAQTITTAPPTEEIQKREDYLKAWNVDYAIPNLGSGYSAATLEVGEITSAMNTIITEAEIAYIKGEIDENGLDDALSRWLQAGGEQATKEMNELYHAAGN